MRRSVKREPKVETTGNRGRRREPDEPETPRIVKKERQSNSGIGSVQSPETPKIVKKERQSKSGIGSVQPPETPKIVKERQSKSGLGSVHSPNQEEDQEPSDRRAIRSQYHSLEHVLQVDDTKDEKKTDNDKNMATMFKILRENKRVKIENLVLNRRSFAQTVENLLALSYLVKDGRVEISVDETGSHFAVPRNAPAASLVMSGDVLYNHFVFRFDYKDWKPMSTMVAVGEELMPHRETEVASPSRDLASAENVSKDSQETPTRKRSRNQGVMIQEKAVIEDSPDIQGDIEGSRDAGIRRNLHAQLTQL